MNRRIPIFFVLLAIAAPLQAQSGVKGLDVIPAAIEIDGLHDGRQLIVTVDPRDATRDASYSVMPADIVRVSTRGHVRPIGNSSAVAISTDGNLFDGSPGALRLLAHRDAATQKLIGGADVQHRFHRSGLLAEIWKSK